MQSVQNQCSTLTGMLESAFKYKYNISEVYDDFLTATLNFFTMPDEKPHNIETFNKYSKEDREQFHGFIMELIRLYDQLLSKEGWCDPLGNIYEELNSKHKASALGQFFTPEHVCDLCTDILYGHNEGSGLRINDPACGSGRMLLSFHVKHLGNTLFAEDLDLMCCKMSAINMTVHGCVGYVFHHNSLDPDTFFHGWAINRHLNKLGFPSIEPIDRAEYLRLTRERKIVKQTDYASTAAVAVDQTKTITLSKGEQLSIF